jgi:hypothetical protein
LSIYPTPGALVWNIKREGYDRSHITTLAGRGAAHAHHVGRTLRPAPGNPLSDGTRTDTLGVIAMADESTDGSARAAKPVLLSGGNPQIPKGDGDAPVQAYIAAMPGWKSEIGRRLDSIIVRIVPDVRKGVRWNSPFYGAEGRGWFLSFHCFTRYVKVAFFDGAALDPVPPGESKDDKVRYLDIYEDEAFDEARFAAWVEQASELPGWSGS